MSVIVTSAGGPCAENAIRNLKLAGSIHVIGTDVDEYMLQLSSADEKVVVHQASEATGLYVKDINDVAQKHSSTMFMPVSDREIYITALNAARLPKASIPSVDVVTVCRNKSLLFQFMSLYDFPIPQTIYDVDKPLDIHEPMWMRAVVGAGGYLAQEVSSAEDIAAYLHINKHKHVNRQFMLSKVLQGKNFCWTGLFRQGKLAFSVTKERLGWVYKRIGTTAVQKTVKNANVSKLCENVIKCLIDIYDKDMTSIMMCDLKEDENGQVFITEINAGRAGTVSLWFGLGSFLIYQDYRVNFHYQLYRAHHGIKLLPCMKRDALPPNMLYIRHIDMGALLMYQDKRIKLEVK